MIIKGKALLVIQRVDSQWVPYEVGVHIQSCTDGEYDRECAMENFACCDSDSLPLPSAAYKLNIGDRIWVAVTYKMVYHEDYWGEWHVMLMYCKERVLKRQQYNTTRNNL